MSQIKIYLSYLPEMEEMLLSARVRLMLTVMISKVIKKLKVKCKLLPSRGKEEINTQLLLAATLFHLHYQCKSGSHGEFSIFILTQCNKHVTNVCTHICKCMCWFSTMLQKYCRHQIRWLKIHTADIQCCSNNSLTLYSLERSLIQKCLCFESDLYS